MLRPSRAPLAAALCALSSLALAQTLPSPTVRQITVGGAVITGVGATAGTVAAGNDTRIAGAVQGPLSGDVATTGTGGANTIQPGVVGNAKLANAPAGTLKANPGGSAAAPSDVAPSALLDAAFGSAQGTILYRDGGAWKALGPGASGQVLGTGGANANPGWQSAGGAGTMTQVNSGAGLSGGPITSSGTLVAAVDLMQGRLTLAAGAPVMTASVSAATAVLYTPYTGNLVAVWNGLAFVEMAFSEYSQALSDTTYSPAAAVAGACYDAFAWNSSGTVRATRGPSWAAGATAGSTTARGAGAGSTELTRVNGILVNKNAVTNGPAAGFGTYLGTFCTDAGGATVSWSLGGTAAGGVAATLNVWNMYNRRTVTARVVDTNQPYAVNTSGSYRNYANSATMRIGFVCGLAEDGIAFGARTNLTVGSAAYHLGVSLNGSQVADEYIYNVTASGLPLPLNDSAAGAIGANALQLIESSSASVTVNSNGANSFNAQLAM